jgi:hypothetical protein
MTRPPHAHRRPPLRLPMEPERERLSSALIGAAAIVVWAFFLLVLLPLWGAS